MNFKLRLRPAALAPLALTATRFGQGFMLSRPAVLAAAVPQSSVADAEPGIRFMLQEYAAALENLDADAVKRIQPSIRVDNLAKAFKDVRELKVTIDAVRILSTDGTSARVSCHVTQTLTPKVGSKQTTAVTRVMRLRREPGAGRVGRGSLVFPAPTYLWIIDGFER
jgi:hypothetical protein